MVRRTICLRSIMLEEETNKVKRKKNERKKKTEKELIKQRNKRIT